MPERPDLDVQLPMLHAAVAGQTILAVDHANPVLLRVHLPGTPADLLVGQRVVAVRRRAHFALFELEGDPALELAIAPMLAGRFSVVPPGRKTTRDLGLALTLSDGQQLRYRDDVQMGKVYLLPPGRRDLAPGLAEVGVDVLSEAFTLDALRDLARGRRDQVKVFLMDKAALDSFGNAYADEVLFAAGLHPKLRTGSLDEARLIRLHAAMVSVLREATDEVRRRAPAMDEKVRDFLKVRNRKGQPCPVCGATIRATGVHGHDAFFCPTCQPDAAGRGLVDWRRTPR